MNMVEKVARAIYEDRNGHGCVPWSRRSGDHKAPYLSDARTAIEAMREPDQNIIEEIRSLGGDVAVAYWLAGHETMIKSALSE